MTVCRTSRGVELRRYLPSRLAVGKVVREAGFLVQSASDVASGAGSLQDCFEPYLESNRNGSYWCTRLDGPSAELERAALALGHKSGASLL